MPIAPQLSPITRVATPWSIIAETCTSKRRFGMAWHGAVHCRGLGLLLVCIAPKKAAA